MDAGRLDLVRAWAIGASLLLGCDDPVAPAGPRIQSVVVQGVNGNVLSSLVTVSSDAADSLLVHYGFDVASAPLDSTTPVFPFTSTVAEVPVLGLEPDRAYRLRVTVWRGALATTSAAVTFTTGSLPGDLPRYQAGGDDATPGYVIFAVGAWLLAIDNTGRVVWYHRLAEGTSLNFMAQPNGRYVARPATPDPVDAERWVELDMLGRITRQLGCAGGMVSRPHDLIALPDGSWWLLCDDIRFLDLTALGGSAGTKVTGTAVQHVGASGELLFQWTPFSHFSLEGLDSSVLSAINWTHGNALDLAADGTLATGWMPGDEPGVLVTAAYDLVNPLSDIELKSRYGLSAREIEVARLVASGLSNQEVAEKLGVSYFTARNHVERLLVKLGVGGRARVAALLNGKA